MIWSLQRSIVPLLTYSYYFYGEVSENRTVCFSLSKDRLKYEATMMACSAEDLECKMFYYIV